MEKLKNIKIDKENQLLIIESTSNSVSATLSYNIGDNITKFSRDLASFSNGLLRLAYIREGQESSMPIKQETCNDTQN